VTDLRQSRQESNEKAVYENELQKLGAVFLQFIFVAFSRGRETIFLLSRKTKRKRYVW
jgi:hypothetical protein